MIAVDSYSVDGIPIFHIVFVTKFVQSMRAQKKQSHTYIYILTGDKELSFRFLVYWFSFSMASIIALMS